MKRLFFPFAVVLLAVSCNDQPAEQTTEPTAQTTSTPQVKTENISYRDDTVSCQAVLAYDMNDTSKRAAILVVPEWWGTVPFTASRAEELAKLGYVAMTVDMYGNGKITDNPKEATAAAMPFYQNPQMAKKRIEAALNELKKHPQVDTSRIGAIGFCFGGTMVLNTAKLGENFDAVISFHGALEGPAPDKNLLKSKILVCHGGDDPFVPQQQVDKFKKQMDSVGANYSFIVYPGAKHAFTNPAATENGKKFNIPVEYNAKADSTSWQDMKDFLGKNLK